MTSGIYLLKFTGTDKLYVGQSTNCEERYVRHINSFRKGTHAKKLQEAYELYGMPVLEIILEASKEELDSIEIEAIEIYNSFYNGFNSTRGGNSTVYGEFNPAAKYTRQQYIDILNYLVDDNMSWPQIAELTNTTKFVVSHICSKESHAWLAKEFPEQYAKLNNTVGRKSAMMQGIKYPKIVSPTGTVFTVEHCTNFAKEHGLLQSKLWEVLNGSRKTHKGWHLESTEVGAYYDDIISPNGEVYTIKVGDAANFAKNHGLQHSNLHKVLTGKAKSHKGWKLAVTTKG